MLHQTELGEELQRLAPAVLSKRTGRAFLGYLEARAKSLRGERHAARTRELSPTHGYDTKFAMHALRIGHQGLELLQTGRISLPIGDPARSDLGAVRAGEPPLADVLTEIVDLTAHPEAATAAADLPDEPDHARIDAFLCDAYERHWAGN